MFNEKTTSCLFFVIILSILFGLSNCAFGKYSGGDGSAGNPYRIETPNDLNDIGNHVEDFNKCFVMVSDIDLADYTGTQFNIIGPNSTTPFTGVFDGNGHTVSNFTYTTDADNIGLFALIDDVNSKIKDLTLIDPNVDAGTGDYVGALVGYFRNGTIQGCTVQGGRISGMREIGGLVGSGEDSHGSRVISNCSSTTTVSGSFSVGGLAGDFFREKGYAMMSNCSSSGNVSGTTGVGGLVGFLRSDISNCYSSAVVSGNDSVGGLIGSAIDYPYYVAAIVDIFGCISDSHRTDAATTDRRFHWNKSGPRFYSEAASDIQEAMEAFNNSDVSAVVELGDFIDCHSDNGWQEGNTNTNNNGTEGEAILQSAESDLAVFTGARYHVIGNWDMYDYDFQTSADWFKYIRNGIRSPETILSLGGAVYNDVDNNAKASRYYTFEMPSGVIGIVLDTTGRSDDPEEYKNQDTIKSYDPASMVPLAQRNWLATTLALYTDVPIVIFCHNWLYPDIGGYYQVSNTSSVRSILETHNSNMLATQKDGRVVAVIQGHHHPGAQGWWNDVAGQDPGSYFGATGVFGEVYNGIKYFCLRGNVCGWGADSEGATDDGSGGEATPANCYYVFKVGEFVKDGGWDVKVIGSGVNPAGLSLAPTEYHVEITDCNAAGSVSATGDYVGGLVGFNGGAAITNCHAEDCNVSGDNSVGGLVGENENWGQIRDCYATGSVSGFFQVGGLVGGNNQGDIINCYAECDVNGRDGEVGGLVGSNIGGTIANCQSRTHVTGGNDEGIGGLIGVNSGSILQCFSKGYVSGVIDVGGLVGYNFTGGNISDSYSFADVNASGIYAGGLVSGNSGTIQRCYSTGMVTVDNNPGGGLVSHSNENVTESFWDIEASGCNNSDGGTGLSTVQMKKEVTFKNAGWDFVGETANGTDDVWVIRNGLDYPKLAWTGYYGGHGTQENPYEIWTAAQMQEIGENPNDWDANFVLEADINLSDYTGTQFNIIGNDGNAFTGVFDGNGHTISNFKYDSTGVNYIGLFGRVGVWGDGGEIQDLGLTDPNIDAGTGDCVGSLAGNLFYGSVSNCYIEGGSVSGYGYVGGLVGISGSLDNTITNCYATCSVWGDEGVGGLIGGNNSNIRNCYSIGSVSGNTNVGGFVGENIAGVAGAASIYNCYARGSVLGDNTVGGLVGRNIQSALIRKCYSTGSVWGNSNVGGLVGINDNFAPDSFWDIESSDCNSSDGGAGKTTAEMQIESTFTDIGWDFVGEVVNGANDVWTINEGASYPKHVWPKVNFVGWYEVDFADWAVFSSQWFDSCPVERAGSDISKDGIVDIKDFCLLADYWYENNCGRCGGADLSGDGSVDDDDLSEFVLSWLMMDFDCEGADLDFSGLVDLADLQILCNYWMAGI